MKRALLALAMLLVATLACNIDQRENSTSKFDKQFLIDPSTILDALAQGKEDVFFEWKDVSEDGLSSPMESVNWSQADYLRITNALHQFVWNEPLDNMRLFRMHFSLSCGETHSGFQNAQFIFFKIVQIAQSEVRIRHGIEIDPTDNHVAAWE